MRYLKTYEQLNTSSEVKDLLCRFLGKNIPTGVNLIWHNTERDMNKNTVSLALKTYDIRKNISYRDSVKALVIEICPVNDKQLRPERIKSKLKISILPYALLNLHEKEFISKITEFIEDVFKKYSYFYKRTPTYKYDRLSINDYYINTSDIDNIMNDLKDFEIWSDTNKYNL